MPKYCTLGCGQRRQAEHCTKKCIAAHGWTQPEQIPPLAGIIYSSTPERLSVPDTVDLEEREAAFDTKRYPFELVYIAGVLSAVTWPEILERRKKNK